MKALKLDETGDFILENGEFVMIEGDEQLAQEAEISIGTKKGEWFLNLDEGMDRTPIIGKNFNENGARSSIIESLIGTSEPLAAESIVFAKVDRTLLVDAEFKKEDGTRLSVEGVRL